MRQIVCRRTYIFATDIKKEKGWKFRSVESRFYREKEQMHNIIEHNVLEISAFVCYNV